MKFHISLNSKRKRETIYSNHQKKYKKGCRAIVVKMSHKRKEPGYGNHDDNYRSTRQRRNDGGHDNNNNYNRNRENRNNRDNRDYRDNRDRGNRDDNYYNNHRSNHYNNNNDNNNNNNHTSRNPNPNLPKHKDPYQNPHVAQTYQNKTTYKCATDLPFTRVLTDTSPQLQYRRRQGEVKTVIHWGQRKLLLSEIEFLTLHSHPSHPVLYAGAAPGTHIRYLSDLFPSLSFILVDPAPFTVKETPQILCRQELFTDTLASEYTDQKVVFMSDIRAADWQTMTDNETEQQIKEDMDAQKRWHEILKPKRSMLKFRLPWKPGGTEYLKGEIYLPVWGPITTTEARLVTEENSVEKKEYDNKKYEEQMFYFNTVQRVSLNEHDVVGEGVDHCYDCKAEIEILKQYLRGIKKMEDEEEIRKEVGKMTEEISRDLTKNRTLASPNPDPEERKKGIQKRQYVDGRPAYAVDNQPEVKRKKEREEETSYSSVTERLMEKWGHKKGEGLGKEANGIAEPLSLKTQQGSRGLGFDASKFKFGSNSSSLSSAVKDTEEEKIEVEGEKERNDEEEKKVGVEVEKERNDEEGKKEDISGEKEEKGGNRKRKREDDNNDGKDEKDTDLKTEEDKASKKRIKTGNDDSET